MGEEIQIQLRDNSGEGGRRRPRPRSASFMAVRSAVFQLTSLSDFKLEKIGSGFFADVYKVYHKGTGEVMVLKMNKSRKNSKQMLSEIQLMNRLCHPNILRFKGSCVHEGHLHALTEYINNGSLEDLLHNRQVDLSWSVRVKIAQDIAKGMAYLHSKGVFHRDLTSKNCLIQKEPSGTLRTVVADFGLAAKIKQARRRSHTEVVGSPYWMAPELLKGKNYCEQADVFSYGIILAEIMARIPADPDFMPRTHYFGMDFETLRKLCPGCPEEMWQLMWKCCQIDPDDRPTFDEALAIMNQIETEDSLDPSKSDSDPDLDPDQDIRSCFSEPLLRLNDSDAELSTSGSEGGTRRILSQKLDSLDSCDGEELISRNVRIGGNSITGSSANSFNGLPEEETFLKKLTLEDLNTSTRTLMAEDESEDGNGMNKGGDSGIDPGEVLSATALNTSYEAGLNTLGLEGATSSSKRVDIDQGDETPLCASPSLSRAQDKKFFVGTTDMSTPIHTRVSWDETARYTAYVTPSGQCASPLARSWTSSEISFHLPSPSTPWAPPSTPAGPLRLPRSLPTSPTLKKFQHSEEFASELASISDSPMFLQPHRRSVPTSHPHSCRNSSLFPDVSNMHSTIYEEGSENTKLQFWNGEDMYTSLEHQLQYESPNQRSRSHSNPAFAVRKQSLNYSLTLARHSPDSAQSNAVPYKFYNIKMHKNARLSSSAPNLVSLYSSAN